ncbi:MAG: NAD(+)/NADH kinase [Nitrosopumilus sp.]|nr:NAD(+)/NADH kinase [Nitrosopumilus sp.]
MELGRVAVISKVGSPEAENAASEIATYLKDTSKVYSVSPAKGAEQVEQISDLENLDLAIALGGDGTTLRVFRGLDDQTPVLAVNVGGNRGILSEITMDGLEDAISQISSGRFVTDKRTRVAASCAGTEFPPALNEIYVGRTNLTRTAQMEIKFRDDTITQKMDGLIVSTPSGSTGHSFSLGGPVLHESLDVLIITPVAPVYRLAPVVVPDEVIQVTCSHDCSIVTDAQVVGAAPRGEPITIKRHGVPAVFVRLERRGLRQMSRLGF